MTIDLTAILTAVIALIGAILTGVAIPYIKSKTTQTQRDTALLVISTAVKAAEQLYAGSGKGVEKKQYVIDWLAAHNVKMNLDEIDAQIEAIVWELKNPQG